MDCMINGLMNKRDDTPDLLTVKREIQKYMLCKNVEQSNNVFQKSIGHFEINVSFSTLQCVILV